MTGGFWEAAVMGSAGGAVGAGSAASGSMEEAVGAGAAAWGSTGAEGVAVGAWKSGGGRRGADPARMGGQSGTGASSGNSGAACSGNWAGTPEVGMGVPAEEEGAGRSSSLVKKSSSWGDVVRCREKGKVVSSKMT